MNILMAIVLNSIFVKPWRLLVKTFFPFSIIRQVKSLYIHAQSGLVCQKIHLYNILTNNVQSKDNKHKWKIKYELRDITFALIVTMQNVKIYKNFQLFMEYY